MIDNPHAFESVGEESTPVACGHGPRGLRGKGTKLRRLASRVAVLAAAAALALIPVPAEGSASSADTPLSADSTEANPEPDVNLRGASARLQPGSTGAVRLWGLARPLERPPDMGECC